MNKKKTRKKGGSEIERERENRKKLAHKNESKEFNPSEVCERKKELKLLLLMIDGRL